ncbi:hypothetical protein AYK26_02000 [Euryarchaeota archaeon SM23-78]|nr:MAG: hypothetical protein AYK26_02000 [Euryarchaeota archaeon SM23-78]MBW3000308.1 hypothetical protein [Candidatus Woesearchaeota archaeon]
MGLFRRKKEFRLPSKPGERKGVKDLDKGGPGMPLFSQQPQRPLRPLGVPQRQQMGKALETRPQIPPRTSPQRFSPSPHQTTQASQPPKEELPTFETGPRALSGPDESFELPDFNEQEIKDLEKKPEPEAQPEPEESPVESEKPYDWTTDKGTEQEWASGQDWASESEQEIQPEPASEIDYPQAEPEPPREIPEEIFLSIRNYLRINDVIDKVKTMSDGAGEMLGQDTGTRKAQEDKYHELNQALNEIQEKLILIDNKLFENP